MQESSFSTQYFSSLDEVTVRTAVDHVAKNLRSSDRPHHINDEKGCLSYILKQQYKSYKNQDKNGKQQKALPLIVLREIHKKKPQSKT